MDFLRPQPKPTWRDAPWWRATILALLSAVAIAILALPMVAWLAAQVAHFSRLCIERFGVLSELAKGTLAMLPYLWTYFFVLERIEHQRRKDLPPQLLERHLR